MNSRKANSRKNGPHTPKRGVYRGLWAAAFCAAFAFGGAGGPVWAQLNPNAKVYRPGSVGQTPPVGAQIDSALLTDYPLKDTSVYQIPAAPAAPAKIYYVAPVEATGVSGGPFKADDTKTNGPATPWSASKAIGAAAAGSVIVFRGGTYRNVNRFFNVRLTFMAYPGEKPLLKGSVVVPTSEWVAQTITQNGQPVTVWAKTGWTADFHPSTDYHLDFNVGIVNGATNTAPEAGYLDMVFVNGQPLVQVIDETTLVAGSSPPAYAVQSGQGVKGLDQIGPGRFYVDYATDTLYIGDDPTSKTVEATKYRTSLSFYVDANRSGPNNSTFAGLGFAHYADMGLTVGAAYTTLQDCTFFWNGTVGVSFQGSTGGRDSNGNLITAICHDAVVQNCFFAANGRKGAAADGAHNLVLRNNTFVRNNAERFATAWDAAGSKIIRTENLRCEYNLFDHNYATGFWMDVYCKNAKALVNEAHDNAGQGLFFEISDGAIIAYNLCWNNSIGILVADATNATVYNNTLSRNTTNLIVKNSDRPVDSTAGSPFFPSYGMVLRNNLLSDSRTGTGYLLNCTPSPSLTVQKSAGPPPVYDYYTQDSSVMFAANGIDYNGYYRKSESLPTNVVQWLLNSASPTGDGANKSYATLTAWKTVRPQYETHGFAIDAQNPNPFFLDETAGDYRLFSGSVAIGRGETLPSYVLAAYQTATGNTAPPQAPDAGRGGQVFPHMGAFGIADGVFVMDNTATSGVSRTSGWQKSTIRVDKYGPDYMTDGNTAKGSRSWTWTPNLTAAGQYRVYLWWPANATQAANVPVTVAHDAGQTPLTVNEQANGGQWNLVGTWAFTPGANGSVTIGTGGTSGTVIVDAVRFVRVP